jgi:hypothetical protein
MRIKPMIYVALKNGARKQAQTFIIGLAVSRVKPAKEGNEPVWLNGNPVVSGQRPSACFPISSLIYGDF